MSAHAVPDPLGRYLTQHAALFDGCTGLPGPVLLLDRLDMALARARCQQRQVGVFFLHNVRAFGDTPHAESALAGRLRDELRLDDTLARVCDGTFVVVCNNVDRDEDATQIAQRLLRRAGVVCRLGITLASPSDHAPEVIARAAGAAIAELSESGRIPEPVAATESRVARRSGGHDALGTRPMTK